MSAKDWLVDKIYDYFQRLDYGYALPIMARLPLILGELLVYVRGVCNALFDLDWRSLALRKRYVWENTYKAMQLLLPENTAWTWRVKTTWRYIHNAREEWEAAMFDRRSMEFLLKRSVIDGIQPIIEAQQQGRSVVLLTGHYDSFAVGIVLLGLHGLRVHAVASSLTEESQVHPAVRNFYWRKYRGMERYLNGGKIIFYEQSLKHFYAALEQGDIVVILGDLPGNPHSVSMPFLGKKRKMSQGVFRMARKTSSLVGAFLCFHRGIGKYHLACSSLLEVNPSSTEAELVPAYDFLSERYQQEPERWWASELLPHYQDAETATHKEMP